MTETQEIPGGSTNRRPLPMPALERWQPLRAGLVELFHYDSEEFWFRDGHLLLRGNNGTGKSKVLSLTMPFLLDAQVKSSRVEPDGDAGKRMAWNLLLGALDRRIGYSWIEFGRHAKDGTMHFLTLGAGLSAAAARPQVESWFFVMEGNGIGPRMNQDLWLTSPERVVLTKERLKEALQGRGKVFETAQQYKRAVDERLFHLGQRRYDALNDTLIQLRQPQLSKKPDEALLSNALSEALPPIAPELLADVADALGQLEDDRHQLEEYERLAQAVEKFEKRYRIYAGTQTRRQARALRQAQTEFDNASRTRTDKQAQLTTALEHEAATQSQAEDAETVRLEAQTRRDTLQSDPLMQEAGRLERAEQNANTRTASAAEADAAVQTANARLTKERTTASHYRERLTGIERALTTHRGKCATAAERADIQSQYADTALAALNTADLVELSSKAFEQEQAGLRGIVTRRREGIRTVTRCIIEVSRLEQTAHQKQEQRDEARDAVDASIELREQADSKMSAVGQNLVDAWDVHFSSLRELPAVPQGTLPTLADWVTSLVGDNPAQKALDIAHEQALSRIAEEKARLAGLRRTAEESKAALLSEQKQLRSGVDPVPPRPYTRNEATRVNRPGAPLWQLIDFAEDVAADAGAGVEAALEASGLLDAWVSPDGKVQFESEAHPLNDTRLLARHTVEQSLAKWVVPFVSETCAVPAAVVQDIIAGIACTQVDSGESEAWMSPNGQFRLGALAGAWSKPAPAYVGFTARAEARARRLAEIDGLLTELANQMQALDVDAQRLQVSSQRASIERQSAPTDTELRQANIEATMAARRVTEARQKLEQTEAQLRDAESSLALGRRRLNDDAGDLQLPTTQSALDDIGSALDEFSDAVQRLIQSTGELRVTWPDFDAQLGREQQAAEDVVSAEERAMTRRAESTAATAEFNALRETVGLRVDALMDKLRGARKAVAVAEETQREANTALRLAGEARAVAVTESKTAEDTWKHRSEDRLIAVTKLQLFAASGMFSAGAPDIELPDKNTEWTIDPALTVARRAEQVLSDLRDDDDTWSRVQKHVGEDLSELQRSLSSLGYQAAAEQTDFGQVVSIVYQNRQERPDRLAALLLVEIGNRRELLTAKEREVLENHLQAEIAAEVQRLLKAADEHVQSINAELHKRPTSTGVRFRMLWQPLSEEEGAPVGLAAARERLLNTSSDLWSSEDRSVVGAMLQQRIAAERERAENEVSKDAAGGLTEQLARALDYRRWHRFRVERWQDKQWRKLSGPASSGERALGLTVPLFAAVASFYGQSANTLAPRLILLDEAFAGIDDAARAHCMALIREFDLDFIITSEREWGCYAELPGVSICQLQRKEGVDAIYVSRWTWDGRAKRPEADPNRRFPPRE